MSAIVVFASFVTTPSKEKEETRRHHPRRRKKEKREQKNKKTNAQRDSLHEQPVFFVRPTFSGFCDGVFFPRFNVHFFLFFLLHLVSVSIIRRLFVVRRHLSSRSQIWTFPSSASEKIFSRYLKAGGKFSLERSLSRTKEEALMPTIESGQITKTEERRSLNEGDQTAEKADDDDQSARVVSFLRVVVVI